MKAGRRILSLPFAAVLAAEEGLQSFHLLELSVGEMAAGSPEDERSIGGGDGDDPRVLMSVRGDGRVSLAGGGGVIVKEGDLEVSGGGAKFEV